MALENLIEQADKQLMKNKMKSLEISWNELYDMYTHQELRISPAYQKLFRWGDEKQSRFVESLLLEMPVQPVYVMEISPGEYELMDGLQRVCSYLRFRGAQPDDTQEEALVLKGCDFIRDLDGLTFEQLPKAMQIKLKRSFVRLQVIRRENGTLFKYRMFKRLHTGGGYLSEQEIRSCSIRLLGPDGLDFLEECSKNKDFKTVVSKVATDKKKTQYDQELVLRFFAIKNENGQETYPLTEYLTRYLEQITTKEAAFDFQKEKDLFEKTFAFINQHWGKEAFSRKTPKGKIRNEFVLYYFDSVSVAVACNMDRIMEYGEEMEIVEGIDYVKYGPQLQSCKAETMPEIRTRIKFMKEKVGEILDSR